MLRRPFANAELEYSHPLDPFAMAEGYFPTFLEERQRWADVTEDTDSSDEELLYCEPRKEARGQAVVWHTVVPAATATTHERGAPSATATTHERGEPAAQGQAKGKGKHVPKIPHSSRSDVGSMCVYNGNWGGGSMPKGTRR